MTPSETAIERLVGEIKGGRCVAFVGAGFSAPLCRTWSELLSAVAAEAADARVRAEVDALLARGTGRDHEVAAQILEDTFAKRDTAKLLDLVRRHTHKPGVSPEEDARMKRRRDLLLGIPFAAILTTNFDDVLPGRVLDAETYGELLRESDRRWLETRFWRKTGPASVLKLHGDLRGDEGITLSRRGYRARLYSERGYLEVLRSVFLTKTVLFIGSSFGDEYINELRSEALAYVGQRTGTEALAYAIVPDLSEAICAHYERHEGVRVFTYDSRGGTDHSAVDAVLAGLHARTHPAKVMGPRLSGKHILWVDPNDRNNAKGRAYLDDAAEGFCTIELAASPEQAVARLASERCDLVITRWGHHEGREPDAVRLLDAMRRKDLRAPVVVFASGDHAAENRETALRLGALEYTSDWETLFEVIDRRFGPPP